MELSQFWWRGEHDNETMTTYGNSGDSVTRSLLSLFSSHKLRTSFSHPCHCLLDNCFHGSRLRSLLCLSKSPPSPPTLPAWPRVPVSSLDHGPANNNTPRVPLSAQLIPNIFHPVCSEMPAGGIQGRRYNLTNRDAECPETGELGQLAS